jgi:hypothetical protein
VAGVARVERGGGSVASNADVDVPTPLKIRGEKSTVDFGLLLNDLIYIRSSDRQQILLLFPVFY